MPKLALLQSRAFPSKEDSLRHHRELIYQAAAQGAQVIVTQELFLTPYFCREEDPTHFDLAEAVPGPTTEQLAELANEVEVVLVGSLFERRGPGLFHNTAVVFGPNGSLLGIYRKAHIPQDPGFEEKFYFSPGDSGYPIWKTPFGTIGVLVCWDQWFPEAARLMALQGAELLIYPTAIGWLANERATLGAAQHTAWETVQRGHAVANGCFVATVNRVGQEGDTEFWGQSFVANPYGEVLARGSASQEEIVLADYELISVDAFRRNWPFFRDRRIETYEGLLKRWDDGRE